MTKLDKEIQEGLYDPSIYPKILKHEKGDRFDVVLYELSDEQKKSESEGRKSKFYGLKLIDREQSGKKHEYIRSSAVFGKDEKEEAYQWFKNWVNDFVVPKWKTYDPKPSALPPKRWYEAMVKGIKKSSDVRNPYAIVKNIWKALSPSKRAELKRREAKGERFRFDLPLPVDKPTKGTGTVRMVKPFKLAEVRVDLSVADYLTALKSGIFSRMKRQDGTTALVARCKSRVKNVNIFVDKARK